MSRSPDCVVIGGALVDETHEVSNLPAPDGGAFARNVETRLGGVGANVAVALDRLGRDVGLVSRIGDDERGRFVRERLAETGVDTAHVAVGAEATSYSLVFSDPDGERMIVTAGESFRNLRLEGAAVATLRDADVVFLTAYTPDPVAAAVLERVAVPEGGPAVVFDLSGPVSELLGRGTAPPTIHGLVHRGDVLVAADVAAAAYFGGEAAALDRLGAVVAGTDGRAVLTHGAGGATILADGRRSRVEAFDVDVVDTTGAGDAFAAGLIDGWLLDEGGDADAGGDGEVDDDRDLEAGVRFAAATAAINCTARAAQGGLPSRTDVEALLNERDAR